MQTGGSTGTAAGTTAAAAPKTAQRIGVPREVFPGEKRVATVPEAVEKLIKLGFSVAVESGAGDAANVSHRGCGAALGDFGHRVQGASTHDR